MTHWANHGTQVGQDAKVQQEEDGWIWCCSQASDQFHNAEQCLSQTCSAPEKLHKRMPFSTSSVQVNFSAALTDSGCVGQQTAKRQKDSEMMTMNKEWHPACQHQSVHRPLPCMCHSQVHLYTLQCQSDEKSTDARTRHGVVGKGIPKSEAWAHPVSNLGSQSSLSSQCMKHLLCVLPRTTAISREGETPSPDMSLTRQFSTFIFLCIEWGNVQVVPSELIPFAGGRVVQKCTSHRSDLLVCFLVIALVTCGCEWFEWRVICSWKCREWNGTSKLLPPREGSPLFFPGESAWCRFIWSLWAQTKRYGRLKTILMADTQRSAKTPNLCSRKAFLVQWRKLKQFSRVALLCCRNSMLFVLRIHGHKEEEMKLRWRKASSKIAGLVVQMYKF